MHSANLDVRFFHITLNIRARRPPSAGLAEPQLMCRPHHHITRRTTVTMPPTAGSNGRWGTARRTVGVMYTGDYTHAKDLFEDTEAAIMGVRRTEESIEQIENYYLHTTPDIIATSSGSFAGDKIGRRISSYAEKLDQLRADLERDRRRRDELVSLAEGVCYGWTGRAVWQESYHVRTPTESGSMCWPSRDFRR